MAMCAQNAVAISFCTEHGRFLARVTGFTHGNVLLRREQYRWADDPARCTSVARAVLLGKLANARTTLLSGAREHPHTDCQNRLALAAATIADSIKLMLLAQNVDSLRGL